MASYKGITADFETITPQKALDYLKTMKKNRPEIKAYIKGMARDMAKWGVPGEWRGCQV